MDSRPDPDELLQKVLDEECRKQRARLKIFFGFSPGVGKTYAMLQQAQSLLDARVDVVIGVAETHGRAETAALLAGLEAIPPRERFYRGIPMREFDLEAALLRRPAVILMDELAHTNIPGCIHPKRWQDVWDLLDAGIDVHATLNVQHLESLNDVVAQITGVRVQERVPDTILERADEFELVDISVEELQERLKEGKVYVPEQARHAIDRFFRKGNLLALRELALRRTAEQVDADMRRYMDHQGIRKTWATRERILVPIDATADAGPAIRAGCRMGAALGAPVIVTHVETSAGWRNAEKERDQLQESYRLAERMGAETVTLHQGGLRIADDLLAYARQRNVTRIVLGRPRRQWWLYRIIGSLLEDLVRSGGNIDIHVISTDSPDHEVPPMASTTSTAPWSGYVAAAVPVVLVTLIGWLFFRQRGLEDMVMLYLLGITMVAARYGRLPSLVASLLSVAAVDFFFVPPVLTFSVTNAQHLGTFAMMLLVGFITGRLTDRIRQQARLALNREQDTQALLRLSADLGGAVERAPLVEAATRSVASQFQGQALIFLPDDSGHLALAAGAARLEERELAVAQWVRDHAWPAGKGTDTLPGSRGIYLPLVGSSGVLGVLGLLLEAAVLDPDRRHLLDAFGRQVALTLERALLVEQRAADQAKVERERLRNTLLSTVSHDLRTPLGSITGAVSTLLDAEGNLGWTASREMLCTVQEEAQRLHRLVTNLLDLTRLESGALDLKKEWTPLEEVIGSALNRLDAQLEGRDVRVDLPLDLPLVPMDGVLMEQVVINLLENAVKYSPPETAIEIKAWASGRLLTFCLDDQGSGITPGDEERIFEKLVRGSTAQTGAGLGLAICRGIVEAHGGSVQGHSRPQGGARFMVTLPLGDPPPDPDSHA